MRITGNLGLPVRSSRLAGQAMLLLLAIGCVQVLASLLFYEAIDRQTIREDHARRVAEFLVVSDRLYGLDRDATERTMTTRHLDAHVAARPITTQSGSHREVAEIEKHIVAWEPSLGRRRMSLDIAKGPRGGRDLVGSMQLEDGRWLNFRSHDISSGWPIALRATVMTLLITLMCIGAGFYALRYLTTPLRQLSEAAEALAHGMPVPVREQGPTDLRNLARSFNDMQARISGLVTDQARSFEAISHDLRTPLSRLKVASDFVTESDIAKIVSSSAEEMEAMLMSLQSFLRAQHLTAQAAQMDLVAGVRGLLVDQADRVRLDAPASAITLTYPEPVLLALRPLIDNALHYGEEVRISIAPGMGGRWSIEIADDGPGIPGDCLDQILDPFCRLDSARPRDTAGFGLGIPTAHRLLERHGGKLSFRNGADGGLIARVDVPIATAAGGPPA